MAASPAETNAELLRAVLAELKQLNELMTEFTNDGFPLARAVAGTETLSAIAVAAALLARDNTPISQQELQQKLAAAPVISSQLIAQVDGYLQTMRVQQLEQLRKQ